MPARQIVDWPVAARVGRAVAGNGPPVGAAEAREIAAGFRDHAARADELVRSFTGMQPLEPPGETRVLGRGAWIDANLDAVRAIIQPLNDRIAESLSRPGARMVGGYVMGAQIGLLLGYVAQRVLGQYDLLLAGDNPGRVYFVGPNIVAAERRHHLDEDDFRLWIALHEITHRTQFLAVPWLREHVRSLLDRYLGGIQIDAGRLRELAGRLRDVAAGGRDALRRLDLMSLLLSPEQRDAVTDMQSLMTVVEGHGNFVMDGVAEKEIPSYHLLKDALHRQRESVGAAERAFQRLIALDMKYRQYAVGQVFLEDVAARAGMEGVNLVWQAPENLPTQAELTDPGAWLARVQPQPTLFDEAR